MLAKLTSKNQLTIPKSITKAIVPLSNPKNHDRLSTKIKKRSPHIQVFTHQDHHQIRIKEIK
jgi:hypothetical protein